MMLKNSRRISTLMRASSAGPLVTLKSGISRRKNWTSPLPCSSTPTTIFMGAKAGTSSTKRRAAVSIRSLASPAISSSRRDEMLGRRYWVDPPHPTLMTCMGTSSDLVPLQELLADHHALDLRSSLADQEQGRIAIETLDLV